MSADRAPGADYSETYDPDADFDRVYTLATAARVAVRVRPGDEVLELGCATGLMSAELAAVGARVTGAERSPAYLERAAARRLPGARLVRLDIDDHPWPPELDGPFEHVLLCNLLHELEKPEEALAAARDRLAERGVLHLTLQNPRSIHRLAALELGLISDLAELSERGVRFGSRRLWDADALAAMARAAGLEPVAREGVVLKPLPNALMAELPATALEGLVRAAIHLPEHGAMSYLVLRRA